MKRATLEALNAERARGALPFSLRLWRPAGPVDHGADLATDAFNGTALGEALAEGLRSAKAALSRSRARSSSSRSMCRRFGLFASVQSISASARALAIGLGLDMSVIDPRESFATPERFHPSGHCRMAGRGAEGRSLDRFTAFVALTHDPKIRRSRP